MCKAYIAHGFSMGTQESQVIIIYLHDRGLAHFFVLSLFTRLRLPVLVFMDKLHFFPNVPSTPLAWRSSLGVRWWKKGGQLMFKTHLELDFMLILVG